MHRIAPCAPYLPRRASDTNKYDYGRVLIVGGCIGYTGAPTLCARAALRCGAGLVSVGVPEAIYAVTAVKNDEAMPFPLPSAEGKLARDALPVLLERLEKSDVCVLGPGLGRNDTLTALVQAVVMQSGTPLVLDADALFAVAQDAAVLARPSCSRRTMGSLPVWPGRIKPAGRRRRPILPSGTAARSCAKGRRRSAHSPTGTRRCCALATPVWPRAAAAMYWRVCSVRPRATRCRPPSGCTAGRVISAPGAWANMR